ncbi:ABC-2 type transporter [Guyanagaster necrorhizus]|uniref:ABC-2 type transporter n=1 Tax=Guyanagaster necrorhizus TaxID=856835 RepID=A0A9P7VIF4_9AGAR|nr:ABC-2 type transporter [Guyanagaster necrorhizus MCA 3950]KAG7440534.1 ABC-2 type transporter [Guyanagaster necrorhizus MCA 3950]
MLIAAWRQESMVRFPDIKLDILSGFLPQTHTRGPQPPLLRIIFTLVSRTLKTNFRDPLGMSTSWIEAVLMGLVVGLIFLHLPNSTAGIRSRQAALYIPIGLQGYLVSMYEICRLTSTDLPIFDREHGEGVVRALPWVVSYRIAHTLLEDTTGPLIYSVISYYLIGFAPSASRFFYYYAIALLVHHASVMSGGLLASMSRDFAVATLISNLAFTLHMFVSGFFLQADSIPVYFRWLKQISHLVG